MFRHCPGKVLVLQQPNRNTRRALVPALAPSGRENESQIVVVDRGMAAKCITVASSRKGPDI